MAEQHSSYAFATRALHVGQDSAQWKSRAVVPPIVMATTFAQFEPAVTAGFEYGRSGNPTRNSLELCMASLDKAKHSLIFSSGVACEVNITHLLQTGGHIITDTQVYCGIDRYFRKCASKFDLTIDYVDFCDLNQVAKAAESNLQRGSKSGLVWLESPTNPLLKVTDIRAVTSTLKNINPNVIIAIDNTFMSPYFQSPLELGVDLVMTSITKYVNGHSDVVMGSISTNRTELYDRLKYLQNAIGAVPSPIDCFMVNRSIKTLALRMEKHQKNAMAVALFLESHPLVKRVLYLGLESHPQHQLVLKQCKGFTGMIAAYLEGTLETTCKFLSYLKIFTLGESLGAVESLIELPAIMTHEMMGQWARDKIGISNTLVRISIGVEDVDDLIGDLDQALKRSQQTN